MKSSAIRTFTRDYKNKRPPHSKNTMSLRHTCNQRHDTCSHICTFYRTSGQYTVNTNIFILKHRNNIGGSSATSSVYN